MISSSHGPTGNLDSEAEAEVIKALMNLNRRGKTILFVTHSNGITLRADNIVYVHDGLVQLPSTKNTLMNGKLKHKAFLPVPTTIRLREP